MSAARPRSGAAPAAPVVRAALPDLVFVAVALLAALGAQSILLNRDGDLARHLRMGDHMLRHGPYVRDVFSHTRAGEPFMAVEWISQILFAVANAVGGLALVTVLSALVLAATYSLVTRFLLRRRLPSGAVAITIAGAIGVGAGHWAARPHVFTMLGLAALLPLLSAGRGRWWHWALLFGIWANLHPGFVLGLALAASAAAGAAADAWIRGRGTARWRRARRLAAGVAAGAAASLINPLGTGLLTEIGAMLGDRYLMTITNEFRPPDLAAPVGWIFLFALLLVAAALARAGRRVRISSLLPILLLVAAAFAARRNISLFGLAALPLAAVELGRALRIRARARRQELRGPNRTPPHALGASARFAPPFRAAPVLAVGLIALGMAGGSIAGFRVLDDSFDPARFPVQAVRFGRALGLEGRLFHEFTWGGYILHAWPEQRIFIDGMTPFFGADLTREYLEVVNLRPGWREILERHGIEIALLPADSRLAAALSAEGWTRVHTDPTAVLLRAPESRALAARPVQRGVTVPDRTHRYSRGLAESRNRLIHRRLEQGPPLAPGPA